MASEISVGQVYEPLFPEDWTYYAPNSMYYYFGTELKTWHNARAYCQRIGGDLARIDSQDKNQFMKQELTSIGFPDRCMEIHLWVCNFFFGLHYLPDDGWYWVDGTSADLSAFNASRERELDHGNVPKTAVMDLRSLDRWRDRPFKFTPNAYFNKTMTEYNKGSQETVKKTIIRRGASSGMEDDGITSQVQTKNGSGIEHRTYSFAEALQCHEFDMSSQGVSEVPKPTIKGKYQAWKILKPIRRKKRSQYVPMEDAGLFSFLWYTWLTPLMTKASKEGLKMDDLWMCPEKDSSKYNSRRLMKLWNEEIRNHGKDKASLAKVFLKFSWKEVVISIICLQIFGFAIFGEVFLVHALLQYVEGTESNLPYALTLTFLLLLMECVTNLSQSCQWTFSYHIGMKLRSAVVATIYRKVLSLRTIQDQTVGKIVNLCAIDGQRIFDAVSNIAYLVGGPCFWIICTTYTTYILGPSAFLGSLTFLIGYPLQILTVKAVVRFRVRIMKIKDKRIRMVNEMITSVTLIKMYAWEKPFAKQIFEIRRIEEKLFEKMGFVAGFNQSIFQVLPVFSVILTFTVHVAMGYELTPAMAYTVIGMFSLTRIMLAPIFMRFVTESFVSIGRTKQFLLMEEHRPYKENPKDETVAIGISMATFAWDKQEKKKGNKSDKEKPPEEKEMIMANQDIEGHIADGKFVKTLFDINFDLKKGQLVGVCGSVGSGKSSLISAILARMHMVSGKVAIDGSIAYVSQQAWIFNATLKENILFGRNFDKQLYERVVFAACLNEDIEAFPNGDDTEIGERGITLSGGQKQRVSLARALYASRDIYLLDDPLSAVDVKVGKHIFNWYIKDALQDKSVFFITQQLQYLSGCDYILVMKDGRVMEHGTHHQLMIQRGQYAGLLDIFHHGEVGETSSQVLSENVTRHRSNSFHGISNTVKNDKPHGRAASISVINYPDDSLGTERKERSLTSSCTIDSNQNGSKDVPSGKLISKEEMAVGKVRWKTYHSYIQQAGGYGPIFIMIISFALAAGSNAACSWYLGYWITQGTKIVTNGTNITEAVITVNLLEDIDESSFMRAYVIILVATLVLILLKCFIFVKLMQKVASNFHNKMFVEIFKCPMSFFDTTPSGRILHRFSKDQNEVDTLVPGCIGTFLSFGFIILFAIISIVIVFPWYLVALIPFIFIFLYVRKHFTNGLRDIKRFENVSRSPWFSQITATVQGLATIHAYGKIDESFDEFTKQLDVSGVTNFLFYMTTRWNAVRINIIVMMTTFLTAIFVVVTHGSISPSYAGIALTSAIQLGGIFPSAMRLIIELEAQFTSVERLYHYIEKLTSEAPSVIKGQKVPDDWPAQGTLKIDNLEIRYRKNLPLALKGVTFDVKPMEKIGIVGRTGAGKSSLCLSLFRLIEAASGTIWIDGVDISTIGLEDLRSRLSIIPQDPVLFVGTIRYNLDPFDHYSDDKIWNALEKCYLKDMVAQLDGKLSAPVMENGENLSVGERQLICMARALLRNSKILMLDEATASIDTKTDSLIQQTIRDAFKDCTMLVIAHRLNTVLNCDKILVMDSGKVKEFDKPSVLLANHNSIFNTMVTAAQRNKEYLK
ncbi:ATP-binding cassette sub-family C member 5-like [Glandiceps talaboti]